jgi:penicillin-binding protein 1A
VQPLNKPIGITKAFIDPKSGLLAQPEMDSGIWEFFLEGSAPTEFAQIEEEIEFEENEGMEEESLF